MLVERCGSKEIMSDASIVASAGLRILRVLQKSPRQLLMWLSSRRMPITNSRVVQRCKPGSSAVEAVIRKASKGAQQLKKIGGGKEVHTKGCAHR